MPAPAQIKIGARLRASLQGAIDAANQAAARLDTEVNGLRADLGNVDEVTKDIRSARVEIQTALGLGDNGAPAEGNSVTGSPQPAQPSPPPLQPGQILFQGVPVNSRTHTDKTAVGDIER